MVSAETLRISVIIPSAAAPDVFQEVLEALCRQEPQPSEIIVVDDAMDKRAYDVIQGIHKVCPVKIIKNSGTGVSAARNTGAASAGFEILVFVDTDVIVSPGSFRAVTDTLSMNQDIDGVVGIQSHDIRFTDFFSRWKNHWMRYTYRRLKGHVHLFYTSCAAIRKSVFMSTGGFDENYRMPSIEDTAFGRVLGVMGAKILPLPAFEIEHVKSYSFRSVLRTDLVRSSALLKFALRNLKSGKHSGTSRTSVPASFIIGTVCMGLFWMFMAIGLTGSSISFLIACGLLVTFWIVNLSWVNYLLEEEGAAFFLKGMIFMPLDVSFVILGIGRGIWEFLTGTHY